MGPESSIIAVEPTHAGPDCQHLKVGAQMWFGFFAGSTQSLVLVAARRDRRPAMNS